MGNSHAVRGLWHLRNRDCSFHLQLGKSASIDLKGGEIDGKATEWRLSYTVQGSTCTVLTLVKTSGGKDLEINIIDNISRKNINGNIEEHSLCFWDKAGRAEAGLLDTHAISSVRRSRLSVEGKQEMMMSSKYVPYTTTTTNAWGGITETTIIDYGEGTRKGLSVREWKKRKGDEKPYMGTLAHYYVNTSSGVDIGLSVVVKIRVSTYGLLDYAVDGPIQHPSSALLYMFEQVSRTRTWKPTACPHCAYIRKQPSLFSQSETESDDSDSFPPTRGHGPTQNAGTVLANDGVIRGNHNGNFNIKNFIFRGRK
ncbi:hypothetical protein SESBI_42788 [Sesbania bispinosa]|nr:hypothetical protein SESBI_42788 [Sesbania bispinosa]